MADKKITQLDELTTPALEDLLALVDDPSGTPVTKKATLANIKALFNTTAKARAYRNGTQSINTGTETKVQLNAESYDPGSNFDAVTNFRFVAPVAGYYQVNASIRILNLNDGNFASVLVKKNNTTFIMSKIAWLAFGAGNQPIEAFIGDVVQLAQNDYLELFVYHTYGSARDLASDAATNYLSVHLLSV